MELEPREPGVVGDHESWNESMYTFWYDRSAGVAGWHRIAQRPNKGTTSVFSCLATSDGLRFRTFRETAPFEDDHRAKGRWTGEGLVFAWDGDVQRIRYGWPECELDLSWQGFHAPVDFGQTLLHYEGDLLDAVGHHVEQAGAVQGRVRVGDREYAVDALGHRDHSWGRRDLHQLLCTRWMIGTMGPELSWSGSAVVLGGGDVLSLGYVVRDGTVVPVKGFDVSLVTQIDGLSYSAADARFDLANGTVLLVSLTDVLAGGILRDAPWVGLECAATATVEGATGVGNCESCNNITGGSNVPPMLISGAAVGEGITRNANSEMTPDAIG